MFLENDIGAFALNSLVIATASTLLALLLGAPAAFALVHFKLTRMTVVILLTRVTPGITLLLPWFILFTHLGWIDTYRALVLVHLVINLPLVIWMLSNFLADVPRELMEAARMDGASTQRAFVSVIMPTIRSGMAAVAILAFILSWNSFLFSIVLAVDRTRTLPVAAFNFMSYGSIEWGAITAVAVIMTLPVVILALMAQRQIIAGLSGRIEV
ncbi:MAG TPA: carbohydrate ABC transporter permease [Propionibacteriaceae bacterium]